MSELFTEIPAKLDSIRLLPPWGGWCMLVGNHRAKRGSELPGFCDRLGIRRMDIIWMDNEQVPSSLISHLEHAFKRRGKGSLFGDDEEISLDSLMESLYQSPAYDHMQQTILDARLGMSETIRFWCGELSPVKEENLSLYLSENAYTPVPLHMPGSDAISVVLDEPLRDMVGAMMLDGLSESEAYAEALSCVDGVDDREALASQMECRKPNHWYKVSDVVYNTFN